METINETHALLKAMTPELCWQDLVAADKSANERPEVLKLVETIRLWYEGLVGADAFLTTMCREGKLTEQADLDTLIRLAHTVVRVGRLPEDQVNGAQCLLNVLEILCGEKVVPENATVKQVWDCILERVIISDRQIQENEQRT